MNLVLTKDMNVFEKMKVIEEQIKTELPHIKARELPRRFSRVSHYVRGTLKSVDEDDRRLYDFLLRNKLNHRTVHNWFLLRGAPPDLRNKLENREIWIRNALKEMAMIRRVQEQPYDKSILLDIRRYIKEVVKW